MGGLTIPIIKARISPFPGNTVMRYKNAVPVIATADIRSSVDYYTRVPGFNEHFVYGEPPGYAAVERDGVLFYFAHDPKFAVAIGESSLHPDVFLRADDVDRVFEEHCRGGAKIVEPVADRPWDARQFVVEDPNGYHLKIAEAID